MDALACRALTSTKEIAHLLALTRRTFFDIEGDALLEISGIMADDVYALPDESIYTRAELVANFHIPPDVDIPSLFSQRVVDEYSAGDGEPCTYIARDACDTPQRRPNLSVYTRVWLARDAWDDYRHFHRTVRGAAAAGFQFAPAIGWNPECGLAAISYGPIPHAATPAHAPAHVPAHAPAHAPTHAPMLAASHTAAPTASHTATAHAPAHVHTDEYNLLKQCMAQIQQLMAELAHVCERLRALEARR